MRRKKAIKLVGKDINKDFSKLSRDMADRKQPHRTTEMIRTTILEVKKYNG
jgi:hypothetical protein